MTEVVAVVVQWVAKVSRHHPVLPPRLVEADHCLPVSVCEYEALRPHIQRDGGFLGRPHPEVHRFALRVHASVDGAGEARRLGHAGFVLVLVYLEVVDGKEVKMYIEKGDKVVFERYKGTEIKLDGTEYIIVSQSSILAVIED